MTTHVSDQIPDPKSQQSSGVGRCGTRSSVDQGSRKDLEKISSPSRLSIDSIIDRIINFDTDDYCSRYQDIQLATANLGEIEKKLWIVNHFIQCGYGEHRLYRLKNVSKIEEQSHVSPSKQNFKMGLCVEKKDVSHSLQGLQPAKNKIPGINAKHTSSPHIPPPHIPPFNIKTHSPVNKVPNITQLHQKTHFQEGGSRDQINYFWEVDEKQFDQIVNISGEIESKKQK